MATVQRIDGGIVEHVRLTDVERVGDEGGKRAVAHIGEQTCPVYYNDVDGPTIWYEQEEPKISKAEIYNREMDKRNRIVAENRDKPWLPFHDGE
jgi:hypothetical protein